MTQQDLAFRKLPPLYPEGMTVSEWPAYREQVLGLFAREIYGASPPPPAEVRAEIEPDRPGWAGKATESEVKLSFDTPNGAFAFPVYTVIPRSEVSPPCIVYISFRPYPDGYHLPVEEIIDAGYAVASFCYEDVTRDEPDNSGIAAMYTAMHSGASWGKIGMWAFAASRVMDYLQSLDHIDNSRVYVVGHSRLGKTALWCAAQDERFAGAGVNNSGCGGSAIFRGKQGERIAQITSRFHYWFHESFKRYADCEDTLPVDQHMLAAMIAPRLLAVSNAEEDIWADPESEHITVREASRAYELLGVPGLDDGGRIGYNLRAGTHFMSRDDWAFYLRFFRRNNIS